jgi:hypothetical protein
LHLPLLCFPSPLPPPLSLALACPATADSRSCLSFWSRHLGVGSNIISPNIHVCAYCMQKVSNMIQLIQIIFLPWTECKQAALQLWFWCCWRHTLQVSRHCPSLQRCCS